VSVKPSYSDQWFVAKPIAVKTHSREINTQSGKIFILSRSFFFSHEPQTYLFHPPPTTSAAPPSHPPPTTSAAPPSNPPLGAHASTAYAESRRPCAAPALGATATGQRRRHALPLTPACSLRSSLQATPSPPSKARRPLPAPPPASLAAPSQRCRVIPASAPVLGPLLNCC
jgi:hypothetical protein